MIHSTLYTILFQVKENNMKKSDSQSYVIFNQSSLVRKHLFNNFITQVRIFLMGCLPIIQMESYMQTEQL